MSNEIAHKSGKGRILLGLLIFLAVLAGGGYFAFRHVVLGSTEETVRTARNHLSKGDPSAARRSLEWLLHFDPDHSDALVVQAASLQAEGKVDDAIQLVDRIDPASLDTEDGITLAALFQSTDRLERAERTLLQYAPKSKAAVAQLVRIYISELRIPDAIRLYTQHWKTDKNDRPTLLSLLELITADPSSDAYIVELKRIDASQPDQLPIVLSLAKASADQGDTDGARERFEKALTIAPDDLRTRLQSARFFINLGETENATKLLTFDEQETAELNDEYWYLQSRLAESERNFDTALKHLDQAISLHPQSETYLQLRARLLRSNGQVDEAVSCTKQCAAFAKARQELGQLYREASNQRFSQEFCAGVSDRLEIMQYTEVAEAWRAIAK